VFHKDKLLELGGVHQDTVWKWKNLGAPPPGDRGHHRESRLPGTHDSPNCHSERSEESIVGLTRARANDRDPSLRSGDRLERS